MPSRSFTPEVLLALPRVSALRLSRDGRSLVYTVTRRSVEGTKYVSDVHRVVLSGTTASAPERLTVGETSDASPRCLADGTIAFLSARPDNDPQKKLEGDDEPSAQLWQLPLAGEPRPMSRRASSVDAFVSASEARTIAFASYVHAGGSSDASQRAKEKARKESGVQAIEFDRIPIRFWDRFHGPRFRHLFVATPSNGASDTEALEHARDLTPDAELDLDEQGFDVSPDGKRVVAGRLVIDAQHRFQENLVLFEVETGASRALTEGGDNYTMPRFSPDGRSIACILHRNEEGKTGRNVLASIDVATGRCDVLTDAFEPWPIEPLYAPDGKSIYFAADERGEVPVFCVDVATKKVRRVAIGGGYSDLCVSPDGATLYALFSTWNRPPEVVAFDAKATDGAARYVTHHCDAMLAEVEMGRVEKLTSAGPDARVSESFLVHPPTSAAREGSKRPLLLWVHGGPIGAWSNHWHWRWNPHVFAARGTRVLLVNPRISLGYGQAFIEEGFGKWGAEPFHDLMAAVDVAARRPDVDEARLAAMGGSFGGYMVNWIAGQTTRFRCIVTHASLFHLPSFHGTTDAGAEWEREFGNPYERPDLYERWSPHNFVRKMKTPMLVVHGERDYRVPVSEAYMLFTALQRNGVPSKLLYFPDENHWILKPQNSALWHETTLAWLDRWLGP